MCPVGEMTGRQEERCPGKGGGGRGQEGESKEKRRGVQTTSMEFTSYLRGIYQH